jgi:hypothetical protein
MFQVEFNLSHADVQLEVAHKMDCVYLFLTEMMKEETFVLFHEPLLAYDSFETMKGENIYFPIVDPFYP